MENNKINTLLHEWQNQTSLEKETFELYRAYFEEASEPTISKLECFPKYTRRQSLSKFMARSDIFRKMIEIHGSVIDCGINSGASLFSFAQLSAIFEPVNYTRKVIGFDTFSGIANVTDKDISSSTSANVFEGGFNSGEEMYDNIQRGKEIFDLNRNLGHISKIEIIKGNACSTIPKYIQDNPHLIVSLLHLDMDIYEPTKTAIEYFLPRMPKGGIIIFDELNQPGYPGETKAVLDTLGIRGVKLQRIPYETGISYAILD
jgi:hypothetical protein